MYDTFKCTDSRHYKIKKEKDNFFGIYVYDYGETKFLTHKPSLKQAQKLCKLLKNAYDDGYDEAKYMYDNN